MNKVEAMLEDYKLIQERLRLDNELLWTRNNYFVAINSLLIAFFIGIEKNSCHSLYLLGFEFLAIGGLLFSLAWALINRKASCDLKRYIELLKEKEQNITKCFKGERVIDALTRGGEIGSCSPSINSVSKYIPWIFFFIWVGISYSVIPLQDLIASCLLLVFLYLLFVAKDHACKI